MEKKCCPECESTLEMDYYYSIYYCANCGWDEYDILEINEDE